MDRPLRLSKTVASQRISDSLLDKKSSNKPTVCDTEDKSTNDDESWETARRSRKKLRPKSAKASSNSAGSSSISRSKKDAKTALSAPGDDETQMIEAISTAQEFKYAMLKPAPLQTIIDCDETTNGDGDDAILVKVFDGKPRQRRFDYEGVDYGEVFTQPKMDAKQRKRRLKVKKIRGWRHSKKFTPKFLDDIFNTDSSSD